MKTFNGKTILVTGASSGIGAAMARQLAGPGVTLLLTARSEEALHTLAEALETEGARAEVFPHDLAQPGAARSLFEKITEAGHTADVLINNAGFGKLGRFEAYGAETYEKMLEPHRPHPAVPAGDAAARRRRHPERGLHGRLSAAPLLCRVRRLEELRAEPF